MRDDVATMPGRQRPPCPICYRPSDPNLRPFCSKRCADIDLHRWLTGHYAIPDERPLDAAGELFDGDDADKEKP